jgi:hypothetical protein
MALNVKSIFYLTIWQVAFVGTGRLSLNESQSRPTTGEERWKRLLARHQHCFGSRRDQYVTTSAWAGRFTQR